METTLNKIEKFFVQKHNENESQLISDVMYHFKLVENSLVYEKLSKIFDEVIPYIGSRNIPLDFLVTEYENSVRTGTTKLLNIIEASLVANCNLKEMPAGMVSIYRFYLICKIYLDNGNQDPFLTKLQRNKNQYQKLKSIVNRQKQIESIF